MRAWWVRMVGWVDGRGDLVSSASGDEFDISDVVVVIFNEIIRHDVIIAITHSLQPILLPHSPATVRIRDLCSFSLDFTQMPRAPSSSPAKSFQSLFSSAHVQPSSQDPLSASELHDRRIIARRLKFAADDAVEVHCILAPVDSGKWFMQAVGTLQPAEFVVLDTEHNEVFVPLLDSLMVRRGRTMFVGNDDYFVQQYLKQQYHVLQRWMSGGGMMARFESFLVVSD